MIAIVALATLFAAANAGFLNAPLAAPAYGLGYGAGYGTYGALGGVYGGLGGLYGGYRAPFAGEMKLSFYIPLVKHLFD